MIRTQQEYREACMRYKEDCSSMELQQRQLEELGLTPEEVDTAMMPLRSFKAQLQEEMAWYENVCRHRPAPIKRLTEVGRFLIALRIFNGMSQRDLAAKLNVSESSVSRDERNDYHGITIERAQRIMDVLTNRMQAPSEYSSDCEIGAENENENMVVAGV